MPGMCRQIHYVMQAKFVYAVQYAYPYLRGLRRRQRYPLTRDNTHYQLLLKPASLLYARNKKYFELGSSPTNASSQKSAGSRRSTRAKAVHLDALHSEASLRAIPPRWQPNRTRVPEL